MQATVAGACATAFTSWVKAAALYTRGNRRGDAAAAPLRHCTSPPGTEVTGMTEAEAFVENWSKVWRGRDSDPQRYMELLHEGCPLFNPISPGTREDLPKDLRRIPRHRARHPRPPHPLGRD